MVYFWVRRQVRKVMTPIPHHVAEAKTKTFTNLYVLSAWAACGIMLFTFIKDRRMKRERDPSYDLKSTNAGTYYGRSFQAPNMQIYEIANGSLSKTGVYRASEDAILQQRVSNDFYGNEETRK